MFAKIHNYFQLYIFSLPTPTNFFSLHHKTSLPPLQNFFLPPAKVYPKAWDEYPKAWDKYPKAWDEYPKLWDIEIWRVLVTFMVGVVLDVA